MAKTLRALAQKPVERGVLSLFEKAGITVNGNNPWDIQIPDMDAFMARLLQKQPVALSLGEAYMDNVWDCVNLRPLFARLLKIRDSIGDHFLLNALVAKPQSIADSKKVGKQHYDIHPELYEFMLGPTRAYSCAYWGSIPITRSLDTAQVQKFKLVSKKLHLEPGMRVLEVGCGWGGLAIHMAKEHRVHVTGITISENQADYARKWVAESNLQDCVDIQLCDYRNFNADPFDRIYSVGMFEHVGPEYTDFFMAIDRLLHQEGLFLLHTITGNENPDPWLSKYIFPHGFLPKPETIAENAKPFFGDARDIHRFGEHYSRTLDEWDTNFRRHWDDIQKLSDSYDERFYRMWTYYLGYCKAPFDVGSTDLEQSVFARKDEWEDYQKER